MKKGALFIIAFINFSLLFANDAKIFSVDSEIYKNIAYLYVQTGHALPNSAGPWSQGELNSMVEKLPDSYENPLCQKIYDEITETLGDRGQFSTFDGLNFGIHGKLNPEFYAHTNKEFDDESDWYYDWENRKNLIQLNGEAWFGKYLYADLKIEQGFASCWTESGENVLYKDYIISNMPYVTGQKIGFFNNNYPQRAVMALGGEHWNVSAGRDVVRWGSGETGNLFLGGNQLYDNTFRFALFYNAFKFSFVTNFYPHPQEVNNTDDNTKNGTSDGQNSLINGIKMFMAHRIDFRFFRDKMNLSVSEAVMYQSSTNYLDLRVLNPVNIYHSLYIRANANSMLSVDFDYTVIPGLNFYTQILVDEFAFFGEPDGTTDEQWRPQKMGYMLGSKYTLASPIGLFKFNLEGVYTDPCLYLREEYDPSTGNYGVSMYGDFREFQNSATKYGGKDVTYLRKCIGYVYGGDAVVGDFKVTFDPVSNYKLGFETFFMAHGIMYKDLKIDFMTGKKTNAPSTEDKTGTKEVPDTNNESGYVEYLTRVSLSGSYNIKKWWDIYARLDNMFVVNKDNLETGLMYDAQFMLGTELMF